MPGGKDLQKELLKARRLTSVGFGGLVQLGMMIPVLNLVLMPAAVVGATCYWVEEHIGDHLGGVNPERPQLDR